MPPAHPPQTTVHFDILGTTSTEGTWRVISPLWLVGHPVAIVATWLSLGWDKGTPLRPWPQLRIDDRNPSGVLVSYVWCGLTFCVQVRRLELVRPPSPSFTQKYPHQEWRARVDKAHQDLTESLTQQWLDMWAKYKEERPVSAFFRLAARVLPKGVDGGDERVQAVLTEIREALAEAAEAEDTDEQE